VHSLRPVPTNRPATAFARGAPTGVLVVLIPSERNASLKRDENFVSLSRMKKLGCARSAFKVEAQIAGLLDNPLPHWAGGDPAEIDPPDVDLDEEQQVETAKQHRIDGEEVAGQHGSVPLQS
jgi:hypothetical protein